VVAADDCAVLTKERMRPGSALASLSGFTAITALLATLAIIVIGGFSETALRLGSLVAWRFAFFVFFAMLAAGPLCNLVPFGFCQMLGRQRRQLVWSFAAAFGVYLLSVLIPNLVLPVSQFHEGLTAGMALFVLFSGTLAAAMAYAATSRAVLQLGIKAQRAMLAIAASFFWLDYSLTALARISGPLRPDIFYGLSLGLMIAALLLRVADRLLFRGKGAAG
jgi:hypothetical protein